MNSVEIVYLSDRVCVGELVYDKDSSIIGYFTGFDARPNADSYGAIECENTSGKVYWVSGRAEHVVGVGLKFVDDYHIIN